MVIIYSHKASELQQNDLKLNVKVATYHDTPVDNRSGEVGSVPLHGREFQLCIASTHNHQLRLALQATTHLLHIFYAGVIEK